MKEMFGWIVLFFIVWFCFKFTSLYFSGAL
jgi:hypothetical protein